jgi:hypothetical protein
VRDLGEARAELVDAHQAVDRKIARKHVASGEYWLWDCFARPGEASQEELRQTGANKDQRWCFRILEPGASRLAHKAGSQSEKRGEHHQLQRLTERGKAVETR